MNKYKIIITGKLMPLAFNRIMESCEVKQWAEAGPIPRDILYDWLKDAEGWVSNGNINIDDELLKHAPKLRVIAQSLVGYDNVDVDACTRHGIPFGNTPGVLVETTADLAFGLLLCATRRIHEGGNFVRAGNWRPGQSFPFGIDLFGKTLGIVGMGQIGAAVAKRARAFGMKIIYTNRYRRQDELAIGATYELFDNLLMLADCIIVLTPLSHETKGLFSYEQFAKMKRTVYFVNAARGAIVDTTALYDALKCNQIAYAALDVTDPEPLPGDHPLLSLQNILITPHIGTATTETRAAMSELTVDNLLAGLKGKPLSACVNKSVNFKTDQL
jgi:glyoxylate reductase